MLKQLSRDPIFNKNFHIKVIILFEFTVKKLSKSKIYHNLHMEPNTLPFSTETQSYVRIVRNKKAEIRSE